MLESATLTEETTTGADGIAFGAVYKPDTETVPTTEFPPWIPLTAQITAFADVPVTAAENCWVCPTCTDGFTGEMEIDIGEETVTVACAD